MNELNERVFKQNYEKTERAVKNNSFYWTIVQLENECNRWNLVYCLKKQ